MKTITATLVNLYHICHRELWLHANEIRMEHTSDVVTEGKLIGEHSYGERADRNTELEIDGVKIDFYDAKTRTVHETKKSDKMEHAHVAQVKYYLHLLCRHGIEDARGIIEYPKLRQRTHVALEPEDEAEIARWITEIREIVGRAQCPPVINKPICRGCSYCEFCYIEESDADE